VGFAVICYGKFINLMRFVCFKILAADADNIIVHSVAFEQAVVKVLAGDASQLSAEERSVLEPFKHRPGTVATAEDQPDATDTTEGFADRILKRRRVQVAPVSYALLEAIPPTSNMVERLFSVARAVLRHERHRLSPMMLEMILFLKVNETFWNVATVEQCL
jgi:hypothetical protein